MTWHFLAVCFKSLWDLSCFFRNFKTGTGTTEYNTLLERSLLGLCNKLSLHSIECLVLPQGSAKHSTKFFKINFNTFPVMVQGGTWVVSDQLHMGFDNKSSASL